jgi:hypothetical protein
MAWFYAGFYSSLELSSRVPRQSAAAACLKLQPNATPLQSLGNSNPRMAEPSLACLREGVEEVLADLGLAASLAATAEGPAVPGKEFVSLVARLAGEAGHALGEPGEGEEAAWVMEVSSVMREAGCPHACLVEGAVEGRLAAPRARLLLLHCLATEVMVARLEAAAPPGPEAPPGPVAGLLAGLGLGPGAGLREAGPALGRAVAGAPAGLVSTPALTHRLEAADWVAVAALQGDLAADYTLRRRMLLARLDATVQSFAWSDRLAGRQGEVGTEEQLHWFSNLVTVCRRHIPITWKMAGTINVTFAKSAPYHICQIIPRKAHNQITAAADLSEFSAYCPRQVGAMYRSRREAMAEEPSVRLPHLLAAREDVAIVEKVSARPGRVTT